MNYNMDYFLNENRDSYFNIKEALLSSLRAIRLKHITQQLQRPTGATFVGMDISQKLPWLGRKRYVSRCVHLWEI